MRTGDGSEPAEVEDVDIDQTDTRPERTTPMFTDFRYELAGTRHQKLLAWAGSSAASRGLSGTNPPGTED